MVRRDNSSWWVRGMTLDTVVRREVNSSWLVEEMTVDTVVRK